MNPIAVYFTDQDNNRAKGYVHFIPREGEIVYLVMGNDNTSYSKYIVENVCHWITREEALIPDLLNCHMIMVYVNKESSDDESE